MSVMYRWPMCAFCKLLQVESVRFDIALHALNVAGRARMVGDMSMGARDGHTALLMHVSNLFIFLRQS